MKVTNAEQFQRMVAEIERKPILTKGSRKGVKHVNFKQEWHKLAIKINALGPPVRTGDGWHKVWKDLKFKVKKKLIENEKVARATGDVTFKRHTLSPIEEAVANLLNTHEWGHIGFHNMFLPANNGEHQFPMMQQVDEDDYSLDIEMPIKTERMNRDEFLEAQLRTQEVILKQMREYDIEMPSTSERKSRKLTRDEILEKQFKAQEGILMEMKSLNDTLKRNELMKRQMYELEVENLKLRKREAEREEKLFEEKMKQNKLNTEIKMKKLELFEKHFSVL